MSVSVVNLALFADTLILIVTGTLLLLTARAQDWWLFYGGYRSERALPPADTFGVSLVPPSQSLQTSHFVAFQSTAVGEVVSLMQAFLARPAGHPDGGPMHVDGAYNWFRRRCPEAITAAAYPALATQRSSRTDVHDPGWYDKLPLVRETVAGLRRIKNAIRT